MSDFDESHIEFQILVLAHEIRRITEASTRFEATEHRWIPTPSLQGSAPITHRDGSDLRREVRRASRVDTHHPTFLLLQEKRHLPPEELHIV